MNDFRSALEKTNMTVNISKKVATIILSMLGCELIEQPSYN